MLLKRQDQKCWLFQDQAMPSSLSSYNQFITDSAWASSEHLPRMIRPITPFALGEFQNRSGPAQSVPDSNAAKSLPTSTNASQVERSSVWIMLLEQIYPVVRTMALKDCRPYSITLSESLNVVEPGPSTAWFPSDVRIDPEKAPRRPDRCPKSTSLSWTMSGGLVPVFMAMASLSVEIEGLDGGLEFSPPWTGRRPPSFRNKPCPERN